MKQPEALRLADALDSDLSAEWMQGITLKHISNELRRLHEENEALRARLAQPEPEELGEIVPANEEQLKRIAKLVEPEPVAWYYAGSDIEGHSVALDADLDDAQKANCTPLYTAPPQREWQGLTDEEIDDMMPYAHNEFDLLENHDFARAIEAKLKAKNEKL